MKKQGWLVGGSNADLQVYETRCSAEDARYERMTSYEEAKADAIAQLRAEMAPYLNRIAELENDVFKTSGRYPRFKVWRNHEFMVSAQNKTRATRMLGITRDEFDEVWDEFRNDGFWWYPMGYEEGVWIAFNNHRFEPCLNCDEAIEVVEEYIRRYETMAIEDLREFEPFPTLVRDERYGKPFEVLITKECYSGRVRVEILIEEGSPFTVRRTIFRDIPKIEPVSISWETEGF